MYGRVAVEVSPGFSGPEVYDDEAVTTFRAAVGDVGYALVTRDTGEVCAEVEAYVVEVAVGVGDCGGEDDGLEDGIRGEVDPDQFGAAVGRRNKCAVGSLYAASVEDPCSVEGVDYDGLGTDELSWRELAVM